MQLHRPKALDELNVDFFSGDIGQDEEKESRENLIESTDRAESEIQIDTQSVPNKTDLQDISEEQKIPQLPKKDSSEPYSKSEILEFLAEDFSKLDEVLDNVPFTETKIKEREEHEEVAQVMAKEATPVDEKAALESFPDLSESIIDLAAKGDKQREKDAIKRAKEDAKNSIENEKQKIKEQKKLEKTVQRPFGKRRAAILLMVLFLIIGILASAACAMIYAVDKSDNGLLSISDMSLGYVDGDKIESADHFGKYILVKQGRIQGNDTLLFMYAGSTMTVADVIGFGDGLYAVNMGTTVYRVAQSDIIGCAKFKTPSMAVVRNIVVGYSFIVFAVLAIYIILVVLLSSMRIKKLNSVIKSLKESYELV